MGIFSIGDLAAANSYSAGREPTPVPGVSPGAKQMGRAAAANIRCHHTNPIEAKLAIEARNLFANWGDAVGGDCGTPSHWTLVSFQPMGRAACDTV